MKPANNNFGKKFVNLQNIKHKKRNDQSTQNKAIYLINGARKRDRVPVRDLHKLADVEPDQLVGREVSKKHLEQDR